MSISSIQSNISRHEKDIADLEKKMAAELKKEADLATKQSRLSDALNRKMSESSFRSKLRDVERLSKTQADTAKKKSDLSGKLSQKRKELFKYRDQLIKEESRERKKLEQAEKKMRADALAHERSINSELRTRALLETQIYEKKSGQQIIATSKKFDFFISHASEDKNEFVRPLANSLKDRGCEVWYDEAVLEVGDSLRRKIEEGISNSLFGIVVLSHDFFAKEWPQKELDGLFSLELAGTKRILPIWHKISKDEVLSKSPFLADKLALNSSLNTVDEIAEKLQLLVAYDKK